MKQLTFNISILLLLTACNNNTSKSENISKTDTTPNSITRQVDTIKKPKPDENESIPNHDSSLINEFKKYKIYNLTDTIKADLNGDNILDFAYFSTLNNKKEITIIEAQTKRKYKIGLDKSFGEMGDDFSWVDFWGTTDDKETYEIVIKDGEITGDRKVKLVNNSIFVRRDEVGGGVITYKDGKFIWVHQSD